ncbi:GNAT family N-acetyltransferase [Rhizobium bangladeshense]|uniref:GNAT family N-acetyltransferase n=1 Tax=Rhizobium bangladeshense TaxID=1138189 RepID=A0ABS7LP16_9HYPH|nr:GNAT family N-acetyltransferase [Rhizobium bangladeshense]MBX4870957.1 GNAT family N-acetyltransferase [Rhizobium bangladeshense]MBX4876681.1 GNAT family N-acetyltransferase [Rhizobium bangladeshense]MBX4887538.1 GNAT family N-acetyltransferase [Rhizobium bangladeshense]MBX4933475.1 GNAT family N-acetyltransferase [Rhizobium bangladeshense]MBY3585260.1 GNAT family N-acetyltransferase [Rhizobium bangladeshense]
MVAVASASEADIAWLVREDARTGKAWVSRCVALGEYLVAREAGEIVGFLRFSRFWGRVPYMEMIRILPGHRRSGVGTALFLAWEEAMRGEGASLLMTSSECDESRPQDWHRRNGFIETGSIELPGLQSVPAVFFIKQIG